MVESKRRSFDIIAKQHNNAILVDVTSSGEQPWVKFSPFYPHGNIPVPLSPGYVAASVEGIWQGLKVFTGADIDLATFNITTMHNIKRTVRRFGTVQGHRAGVNGTVLLEYIDARYDIYLPAYRWVLDHCLQPELSELRAMSETARVVLLDYETNGNIENASKPLSHATLIIKYIKNLWPIS